MQLYRTGGDAAAEQARLLRREGVVAAAEPDDVRDVDDGVLGEAGDGQEVVDGLAGGGEREARRAVPRHAAAARQRGAEVAAACGRSGSWRTPRTAPGTPAPPCRPRPPPVPAPRRSPPHWNEHMVINVQLTAP